MNTLTEPEIKKELIAVDENGRFDVSEAAVLFAERCAASICEQLTGIHRQFSLMPYRLSYDGTEFLGFDWSDGEGGRFAVTIGYGRDMKLYLPDLIRPRGSCDVAVSDATDALQLCRLIAQRVLGSSAGTI